MSQLTTKELRFSDIAVSEMPDGSQREAWKAWYESIVQPGHHPSGLFAVPGDMVNVVIQAIRTQTRRMQDAISTGEADDSDLINDLEVFLNIEHELTVAASA